MKRGKSWFRLTFKIFSYAFPVLAGALLEHAESLITRGIHPIRVVDGFERACKVAVKHLDKISDIVDFTKDNIENLFKTTVTSLGSKMYAVTSRL